MSIRSMLLKANHAVVTQSPVYVTTSSGGRKITGYTDVLTIQPCWVQPANSRLRLQYQERQIVVTHRVYFDSDPVVDAEWRLKFGARLMKVIGAANTAELGRLWTVDCEEVKS